VISSALLIETFTPQTLVTTDDGMGGMVNTWSDGTAFKGRLSSLTSQEQLTSNKVTLEATHKLFCQYQVISELSRIRNADSTRYFAIVGIINPSNSNNHLEIYVKESK
jgi:head-tail adaptor